MESAALKSQVRTYSVHCGGYRLVKQTCTSSWVCSCIPVYQLAGLPARQRNSCHLCMNGIDFLWSFLILQWVTCTRTCVYHIHRLNTLLVRIRMSLQTHSILLWDALLNQVVQDACKTKAIFPYIGFVVSVNCLHISETCLSIISL